MIIKNESLENGKHNAVIEDVEEILSTTSPAIKITYKTLEDDINITQRYPANLRPGSPLLSVVLAVHGEVPKEIDTDDFIGNECTIEVDYIESNNRYYQNVVNVYPLDSSDDETNSDEEDGDSYDEDGDSYEDSGEEDTDEDALEDIEEEEEGIVPPTKVNRKRRNFR